MSDYISREAFLAEQRHMYCENCARRKNGKGKFVYDIGDAPCRSCDICDVLDAVEDAPAADVRPVKRGKWIDGNTCSLCGTAIVGCKNFCPNCGAMMEES